MFHVRGKARTYCPTSMLRVDFGLETTFFDHIFTWQELLSQTVDNKCPEAVVCLCDLLFDQSVSEKCVRVQCKRLTCGFSVAFLWPNKVSFSFLGATL